MIFPANDDPITFFDVDGVLVQPWIIYYFPKFLANQESPLFDQHILYTMEDQLKAYKQNGDYMKFAENMIHSFAEGIEGKNVKQVKQCAYEFWFKHWEDYVYTYSSPLVKILKQFTVPIAISASPLVALQPLCQKLGINYVEGLNIKECDLVYTKEIDTNLYSKQSATTKYLERLSAETKNRSFAFGDTIHDYPLFKDIGNPYLIIDDCSSTKSAGETMHELLLNLDSRIKALYRSHKKDTIVSTVSQRLSELF